MILPFGCLIGIFFSFSCTRIRLWERIQVVVVDVLVVIFCLLCFILKKVEMKVRKWGSETKKWINPIKNSLSSQKLHGQMEYDPDREILSGSYSIKKKKSLRVILAKGRGNWGIYTPTPISCWLTAASGWALISWHVQPVLVVKQTPVAKERLKARMWSSRIGSWASVHF